MATAYLEPACSFGWHLDTDAQSGSIVAIEKKRPALMDTLDLP